MENRGCVCLAWMFVCALLALYITVYVDVRPHWNGQETTKPLENVSQSGIRVGAAVDTWKEKARAHGSERANDGSRCKEIFNIGAGGPLGNVSESLLQRIREAKSGGDPWDFDLDAYDQLSYSMPSLLPPRGETGSSGFLGGGMDGARSVLVPWLPCRLHLYRPPEVRRCFLRRRRENMSNHIMFVGDSRTRRTFQAVGRLLRDMDVTYHLHDGSRFNWTFYNGEDNQKRHERQFVTSELMPGFLLQFFFVSNFAKRFSKNDDKNGAKEIFMKLLRQPPAKKRPALVVINSGTWSLAHSHFDSLKGLDDFCSDLSASATVIRALAKKLPLVFWVSDPYKTPRAEYIPRLSNNRLEWSTRTLLWKLRDSDVMLWDSTLPMAMAYRRDCLVVEDDPEGYGHLYGTQDWMCFDSAHLGFVPLAFRAQIILNYLCNGIEEREGVCCA